jgi:hypothetical protein
VDAGNNRIRKVVATAGVGGDTLTITNLAGSGKTAYSVPVTVPQIAGLD